MPPRSGGSLTLIVGTFSYAGSGWRTIGDALLANSAAAKAREHRRVAKEESAAIDTYVSDVIDHHEFAW